LADYVFLVSCILNIFEYNFTQVHSYSPGYLADRAHILVP
jgi:hypothetical protein